MNVSRTQSSARSTGSEVRRTVNKGARTVKTAAMVGIVAVTGFVSGFIAPSILATPAELKKREAKRAAKK